ncbi:threonine synthase-like 2 [Convolutriloba macropyga]|uniref:threonine synthase-like 2 n=1 Tax=Convolutriloba macropyga TaxID=536237 RepID=UPI003F51C5D2
MRFVSTRSKSTWSFQDAVLSGWAPDGGMLMPDLLPSFSRQDLQAWSKLTYPDLGLQLFKLMLSDEDFSHCELEEVFGQAFAEFGCDEIVRVHESGLPLKKETTATVHVAELWHGPTLAFKDLGLQVLAKILQKILQQRNQKQIMLVGTSGDTGSAAIESVMGIPELGIVVLYPARDHSGISASQEAQICRRAGSPRVRVIRCEGTSDDLDVPIDNLFHDSTARSKFRLGSLNSVNVVRLLMQVVHLFYSYLQVEPRALKQAVFAIPTGAGGHITAAIIAARMGLPVRAMLACTNDNDLLPKFLQTGIAAKGEVHNTSSPAMDVQVPYNIERILHLATYGDSERVKAWMATFYSTGRFEASPDVMDTLKAMNFWSISTPVPDVKEVALSLHSCCGYLIDPHTCVGMAGLRQFLLTADLGESVENNTPLLCMACAHPAKFPAFIQQVLNLGEAEAGDLLPNPEHRWVHELLDLVAATDNKPLSCDAVFKESERSKWTEKLFGILEGLHSNMSVN